MKKGSSPRTYAVGSSVPGKQVHVSQIQGIIVELVALNVGRFRKPCRRVSIHLGHIDQSRLGTLGPSHVRRSVVHLVHGGIGWVSLGIGIDVATAILRRRGHVGRRLPANIGHMRAAVDATRSVGLMLLEARLQSRGRAVAGGVGSRADSIITARRGGNGATDTHMYGKRTVLLEV